jgi:hypothetical protein
VRHVLARATVGILYDAQRRNKIYLLYNQGVGRVLSQQRVGTLQVVYISAASQAGEYLQLWR